MWKRLAVLGAVICGAGCDLFGVGGGGGGGENDGGVSFTKGFVYVRAEDRNLWVVNDSMSGEPGQRLTSSGGVSMPSLSADGKQVVFGRRQGSDSSLMLLTLATGQLTTIFSSTGNERNVRAPVFAPSGTRVAFAYDVGSGSAVGVVNVDGTGFARVVGDSTSQAASPSFLSENELLVARGGVGLRLTQIDKVTLGTDMVTPITNQLGNEVHAIATRIVASPNGTQAVFDGILSTGATRIFVIDLATKQVSARLNDYRGEPEANDSSPCWMSSSTVAFSSDSGGNDAVYSVSSTPGGSRSVLVPKAIEPWYGPF